MSASTATSTALIPSTSVVSKPLLKQANVDTDGNGIDNIVVTYAYDTADRVTFQNAAFSGGDVPGFSFSITYTYDEVGNLIAQNQSGGITILYTYDESGNVTGQSVDTNSDGISDQPIYLLTYNEAGKVAAYSTGFSGGIPTQTTTYTYDSAGSLNTLFNTFDFNRDGTPEVSTLSTYAYNASGLETSLSIDYDQDGVPNYLAASEYIYDAAESLTRTLSVDSDADGKIETIYTYTYNADGSIIGTTTDDNADGILDYATAYTYDSNGNFTGESIDSNADGTPDSLTTYTYNEADQITGVFVDRNADGTPDGITRFAYDAAGSFISETRDNDGDGKLDFIVTYAYENSLGSDASALFSSDDVFDSDATIALANADITTLPSAQFSII